ncbi:conserved Plasmodium protein, unknown function [Plasmodium vivax]|nr:conserved Plasmodium protein, unknown function [Plasmodium vivax]
MRDMTGRSTRIQHKQREEEEAAPREANTYWQEVNLSPKFSISELDPWGEEEGWSVEGWPVEGLPVEGGHTDGEGTLNWDATNMAVVSEAKSLSLRGGKRNPVKKTEAPFGKAERERKKTCESRKKNGLATSKGTRIVGICLDPRLDPRLDPPLGAQHRVKKKDEVANSSAKSPSEKKPTALGTLNWKGPLLSELKSACKMGTTKGCRNRMKQQTKINVNDCVRYTQNCKSSFGRRRTSRVGTPLPFHCAPLSGETKWKKREQGSLSRSVSRRTPTGRVRSVPKGKPPSGGSVRSGKSATNKRVEPTKIKHVVRKPPRRLNGVTAKGEQKGEVSQRRGSASLRRNITGSGKMLLKKRSCRKSGMGGDGSPRREKENVKERGRKDAMQSGREGAKGEQHSSATVRSRIEDKRQELLRSFRRRLSGGITTGGGCSPRRLEREMSCGVTNTHVYTYVGSPSGEHSRDAPEGVQEGEKRDDSSFHPPPSSNTCEVSAPCGDHLTHFAQGAERNDFKTNTQSSDDVMMGRVSSSSGSSIEESKSSPWVTSLPNEPVVSGKRRAHSLSEKEESRALNPLILTNDLRIKICYSNNYVDLRGLGGLPLHERVAPEEAEDHVGTEVAKESSKRGTRQVPKHMEEEEPHVNYSPVSHHSDDHLLNMSDDLFLISQDSEKMKLNGYMERINSKETFEGEQGCTFNSWEGQPIERHTYVEGNLPGTSPHLVNADQGKETHPRKGVETGAHPASDPVADGEGAPGVEANHYVDGERANEQPTGWCTPQLGQHKVGSISRRSRAAISKGNNLTMGGEKLKRERDHLSSDIKIKNHSLWGSADEGERQMGRKPNDAHVGDHVESLRDPFLNHEEGSLYTPPFNVDSGSNSTSASLWECPRRKFFQREDLNCLVIKERHLNGGMQGVGNLSEVSVVPPVDPKERINNTCHRNSSGGRTRNGVPLELVGISQMEGTSVKLKESLQVNHPCGVSTDGEETRHCYLHGEQRDPHGVEQNPQIGNNFPFEAQRRRKTMGRKSSGGPISYAGVKQLAPKRIGTKWTGEECTGSGGEDPPAVKEERRKKKKKKPKEGEAKGKGKEKEKEKAKPKAKSKIKVVKKKAIPGQTKRNRSAKPPQHCEQIVSTKNQGENSTHRFDDSTGQTNGANRKVTPHVGTHTEEAAHPREREREKEKAGGRGGAPRGSGPPPKSSPSVNHHGELTSIEKDKKKKVKRSSCQVHHSKGNMKDEEVKKKVPSYALLQMLIRKKTKKGPTDTDTHRGRKNVNRLTCSPHEGDVVGRVKQQWVPSPERRNADLKVRSGCSVSLCGAAPGGRTKKKGGTQKKGAKGGRGVSSGKRGGLQKGGKERGARVKGEVLPETQACFEGLAEGGDCGEGAPTEKPVRDAKEVKEVKKAKVKNGETNSAKRATPNSQTGMVSPRECHQEGGTPKMGSTPAGKDPPREVHPKMGTKRGRKKGEKREWSDEPLKDGREGTVISVPPPRGALLMEVRQRSNVHDSNLFLGQSFQEVSPLEGLIQERYHFQGKEERSIRQCAEWGEGTDEPSERSSTRIERERGDQVKWAEERSEEDSLAADDVEKFHQTYCADKLEFPLGGLSSGSRGSRGSGEEGRSPREGGDPACGQFSFSLNLEQYVENHRINRVSLKRSLFGGSPEGDPPGNHRYSATANGSDHMGGVLAEGLEIRTIGQSEDNAPPQRRSQITWSKDETDGRNGKLLFFKCNEREVMNVREGERVTNDVKEDVPHLDRRRDAHPDDEEGKACCGSPVGKAPRDHDRSPLRVTEGGVELKPILDDLFLSRIKEKKKKKNYLFRAVSMNDIHGSLFPQRRGCANFGEEGDSCKKKLNMCDGSPSPHLIRNHAKCIPRLLSRTNSLLFRRGRSDCGGGILTQGGATPSGGRKVITKMAHHPGALDEGGLLKKKETPSGSSRPSGVLPKRDVALRPSRVNIFRRSKSCSMVKGRNAFEGACAWEKAKGKADGKADGKANGKALCTTTMLVGRTLTCGKPLGESHSTRKSLLKSVQTQTSGCLWSPCLLFESSVKE